MNNKKDCNCKAKKNADKLIKNVEDINKSSSKNYVSDNYTKKIIFNMLKVLIYVICSILLIIFFIPIVFYILISKKQIKISLNLNKHNTEKYKKY